MALQNKVTYQLAKQEFQIISAGFLVIAQPFETPSVIASKILPATPGGSYYNFPKTFSEKYQQIKEFPND